MRCLLAIYFIICYVKVSICLRVVGITVPSLKQRGESVTLTCDYDLEGGKLYSVKWYRDNEEFYRYMPRLRPPQHAHKLQGVRVDLEKSSARRVHLREVTLKSRGLYRCEVSEEAPSFHSAQSEAFMEIYYFTREGPRIVGHERPYELLEPLDVNCSSAKAYPAPDLQWHIDGHKVKKYTAATLYWPTAGHGFLATTGGVLACTPPRCSNADWWKHGPESNEVTDRSLLVAYGAKPAPQGLLISTLGLRAPAMPHMKLRCIAAIGPHKRERTVVIEISSANRHRTSNFITAIMVTILSCIYLNIL